MHRRKLILVAPLLVLAAVVLAAEPATKPGETKTLAGGLKVTYVQASEGARDGDILGVIYTGKFADGKVFDSSAQHGGAAHEFVLGQKMVIAGWDQGLQGMHVGEKRLLEIPPELGYGKEGRGPIPGNATLTFDVELVSHRRAAQPPKEQ